MRVAATHKRGGLFVIDSAELEDFKPAQGEEFVVDLARRRNVDHHRKGFALLRAMHANQDRFDDIPFDQFRKWVTLQAGYFDTFIVGNREYIEPHSLAFDKMDQSKFDAVYRGIVTVAVEKLNQEWAIHYE